MPRPAQLIMSVDGAAKNLPPIPTNLPTQIDSFPVTYKWKAMIEPGRFSHPQTREPFTISRNDITQAVHTHKRLRDELGFKPYIPKSHKHTLSDGNLGFVIDYAEGEDGKFYGLHQFIGEDARLIAARNESSVKMWPAWSDQHGREWANVIEHNAACPDPVLTKLGGFVEVAFTASRGDTNETRSVRVPLYTLSRGAIMSLEELAALLGLPATATLEQVKAELAKRLTAPAAAAVPPAPVQASREDDEDDDDEASTGEVATLRKENKKLVRELSKNGISMDAGAAMMLEDRAGTLMQSAEQRVKDGKWTPAQRDAFRDSIIPGGKPNSYMLSRSGPDRAMPAQKMFDAFDTKAAPEQGETTTGNPNLPPIEAARQNRSAANSIVGSNSQAELDDLGKRIRERNKAKA